MIETLVGNFKDENVLEGFRANTEHLCNDTSGKNFSDDFLKQCEEDLIIIDDLAKSEQLKIPPTRLISIVSKPIKL